MAGLVPLLWLLLLLTALVLLVVLRQLGLIYATQAQAIEPRPPSPRAGDRIGPLEIDDAMTGETLLVPFPGPAHTLLILASADCGICKTALRGVGGLASVDGLRVLVVSSRTAGANRDLQAAVGEGPVFVSDEALPGRLSVPVLPWAAVITPEGSVLEARPVGRLADVERMLDGIGARPENPVIANSYPEVV